MQVVKKGKKSNCRNQVIHKILGKILVYKFILILFLCFINIYKKFVSRLQKIILFQQSLKKQIHQIRIDQVLQKTEITREQRQMKRPFSATVIPTPDKIVFKSKIHNHEEIQNHRQQKQQPNEQIEIKSYTSNPKRLKIPQNMKNFLRDRKLLRQINKNKSQKSLNQNPKTQNKIDPKKQKPLNQTNFQIIQLQDVSYSQQVNLDKIVQQNPSMANFSNKQVLVRPNFNTKSQKGSKTIICSICQGQVQQKNQVKAFTCRHIYCDQCLNSYIKYKISLFEQVNCPQESCSGLIDTQKQFYKKFSKRQRRIYKKINNFYQTQNNQNKRLCPRQQCQGVIDLQQNIPNQKCSMCKKAFCSKCFLQSHEGVCREYEIKFIQDNLHYKQCSKCKIIVQRIQGCNHITCKCGYQFCYICGGSWKHDHICRPPEEDMDSGCDWGQNWEDHFWFLIKLPLKFILVTIYTCFWIMLSFSAAPYNIFFFLYWVLLIFIGGPVVYIFQQQDRKIWQICLLLIVFPILMIVCVPQGVMLFLQRFEQQCPYISDGYRCMIRI